MRTAASHAQGIAACSGSTRPCLRLPLSNPRTTARPGPGQLAAHRCLHHAKHAPARVDERDVDGELAIALDELARAIERIDQPVARPLAACFPVDVRRFLGQDWPIRGQSAQAIDDAPMCGKVGGRQRRAVILLLDRELAVIDGKDVVGSLPRNIANPWRQLGEAQRHGV